VAIEQRASAVDAASHAAEALPHASPVAAAGEERELIAGQAAGKRGRDHHRQGKVSLVGGKTSHDQDRFTFETGADQHHQVAVPLYELAQGHS
jgi:hypothetical protein